MLKLRALAPLALLALVPALCLALLVYTIWGLTTGHLHVRLVIAVAKVIALPMGYLIYRAIKEVRAAGVSAPTGVELTRNEHPTLWAHVDDLAAKVGTRSPDHILLVPEANAMVTEVKKVRYLCIGVPLLVGFTVGQLRTVIAHELGHYLTGTFSLDAKAASLRHILFTLAERSEWTLKWFFKPLASAYLRLSQSSARALEWEADACAARASSAADAASAMERLAVITVVQDVVHQFFADDLGANRLRASLTEAYGALLTTHPERWQDAANERLSSHETTPWDSHPPLSDRIARFRNAPCSPSDPAYDVDAVTLITDGTDGLTRLEAGFFPDDLQLTDWSTLSTAGALLDAAHRTRRLLADLRARELISGNTYAALFELPSTVDTAFRVGRAVYGPAPTDDVCRDAGIGWLAAAVQGMMLEAGVVRRVVTWDEGHTLCFTATGEPVDWDVELAGFDEPSVTWVRTMVDRHGLNPHVVPGQAADLTDPEACFLAAATHMKSTQWDRRHDILVASTGFLALPSPPWYRFTWSYAPNQELEMRRLRTVREQGVEAARALPGAIWYPATALNQVTINTDESAPVLILDTFDGGHLGASLSLKTETSQNFLQACASVVPDRVYLQKAA